MKIQRMVRGFQEKCKKTRRRSLKKDTKRYASERGPYLKLNYQLLTPKKEKSYLERKSGLWWGLRKEKVELRRYANRNDKESWLKQDGMTRMWLAVSVGYAAWKLRPRTQLLEFTNYTNSYSPLRFTNSAWKRQATTQTSSVVCAENLWKASFMFWAIVAY